MNKGPIALFDPRTIFGNKCLLFPLIIEICMYVLKHLQMPNYQESHYSAINQLNVIKNAVPVQHKGRGFLMITYFPLKYSIF